MNLTLDQLKTVQDGEPLRFVAPEMRQEFVVVRADVFDRVQQLFDSEDFEPGQALPLVWQAMKRDWEDPAMDAYDNYPESP